MTAEEAPAPLAPRAAARVIPSSDPSGSHGSCAHDSEANGPVQPAPIASLSAPSDEGGEGEASEASDAPIDLEPLLSAARGLGDPNVNEHEASAVARQAADELFMRLAEDPHALGEVVARFGSLTDDHELGLLAAVLGRLADPVVEDMALSLAERGTPAQRAAAFDVLDNLNVPSARDAALKAIQRETHVEVRRAALRAVPPPAGSSLDDAAEVRDALNHVLARDEDTEARRRASITLTRYATTTVELQPVLDALLNDPDPNVRAGAAFGLETTAHRDDTTLRALVAAMSNDADPLVRENAWQALRSLSPLPPSVHAAYVAYADARDARGEGNAD